MVTLLIFNSVRTNNTDILGGRHSTVEAFTLCAPAARVRITAPEIFSLSDAAVLINSDSALLRAKSEQSKTA